MITLPPARDTAGRRAALQQTRSPRYLPNALGAGRHAFAGGVKPWAVCGADGLLFMGYDGNFSLMAG